LRVSAHLSGPDLYATVKGPALPHALTTGAFKARVFLLLLTLLLFVLVYLGLTALSAYLLFWGATAEAIDGVGKRSWMVRAACMGGGLMLSLFFAKGIFRRRSASEENYVELFEADQPRLFAFLRRVCAESEAPFPRRVLLNHDVNAAVLTKLSFWALFLPSKKDLLIGAGLVSALDVTEFKAVLAHEFGHFSQRTTKFAQYVYQVNSILLDMLFARDWFDELLDTAKRLDLRIAVLAYGFSAVVWVLRKFLRLLFYVVNLANFSLSRQMEFDADTSAVRLAGSDAIVSSLWKADRASLALAKTSHDLHQAVMVPENLLRCVPENLLLRIERKQQDDLGAHHGDHGGGAPAHGFEAVRRRGDDPPAQAARDPGAVEGRIHRGRRREAVVDVGGHGPARAARGGGRAHGRHSGSPRAEDRSSVEGRSVR
jgi:Zn-dependent protease with chaperone function